MADNNQYTGFNSEQKAAVADPKNQAFSMKRAWSNLKSGLGISNPQKDALSRKKQAMQISSEEGEKT